MKNRTERRRSEEQNGEEECRTERRRGVKNRTERRRSEEQNGEEED